MIKSLVYAKITRQKKKEAELLCSAEVSTNVSPPRIVTSPGVISQSATDFRKMDVPHIVSN
jgi:hypothetical protein